MSKSVEAAPGLGADQQRQARLFEMRAHPRCGKKRHVDEGVGQRGTDLARQEKVRRGALDIGKGGEAYDEHVIAGVNP